MRNPDIHSQFSCTFIFFHSGYVTCTTHQHQNTWYQEVQTQAQKHLFCWVPTELSGMFRVSPGAKSCNGWLNWSFEEEARTTHWARKCSKNKTQELPGSLFPIQDSGSDFFSPLISWKSNKGWHRSPQEWSGDGLCISAFTVTDVPGNQHRKYLRRGMWQIWTYLIERK